MKHRYYKYKKVPKHDLGGYLSNPDPFGAKKRLEDFFTHMGYNPPIS
jgi:hypothetical protein